MGLLLCCTVLKSVKTVLHIFKASMFNTYHQIVLHLAKVCYTLPKCVILCQSVTYFAKVCNTFCYTLLPKCYTKWYSKWYSKCYTKCYTLSNAGLLSASRVSVEWTASLLVRLCRSFKETIILWCWGFNHNMLWKVIMVTMVWRTAGPSKKRKNAADLERNQEVRIKVEVVKMMGLVDCQHLCTVHTPAEYNRLKWK